jgi:ribosomal protein L16/L10AE
VAKGGRRRASAAGCKGLRRLKNNAATETPKFRKAHKGRIHGNAKGGVDAAFGAFGLKAQEPERVTARQIEAARRAITRR